MLLLGRFCHANSDTFKIILSAAYFDIMLFNINVSLANIGLHPATRERGSCPVPLLLYAL